MYLTRNSSAIDFDGGISAYRLVVVFGREMEREDREVGMMMHESFVWGCKIDFANTDGLIECLHLQLHRFLFTLI